MLDTAEEVHQQDASDTIEVEEEPEQTMIKRRRNNERRKLRLKSATTRPRRTVRTGSRSATKRCVGTPSSWYFVSLCCDCSAVS